ncbi:mannose/glucose-specific lectin Cramoll-like [Salvia miltiorrhiza]|uniref:mannose/glucose-specific lectin Cramoll-like n=1 Tax=Salvia miltiorrhiza TaxID=226208 RepID=UPI0025ABD414|nr:mannose/glucose-specific lectin Cramoll-like [Salvia miltiorrhiza]
MAKLLQTLISIALLLAAAANTARSQSTAFTYDFWGDQPTDLLYQGDAHFPSDSTFLRMTNTTSSGSAVQYSVGRAVYSAPITFWEAGAQVDFETTLTFAVTPNAGDTNPADGVTFFIAPVGLPLGFTGGCFGIFNSSGVGPAVFAVEFDVFSNPGVDPSYRHIGIDIESNVSKNVTNVGNALLGQQVTARINYLEATKLISVSLAAGSQTYEVSYVYDLSAILPQQVQVGISGATGGEVAVHDIVSWYFTSTLVHADAAAGKEEEGYIRQYV